MTTGTMFRSTCYATQYDAAMAACSEMNAFGADGSKISCAGPKTPPTPSSTAGGSYVGIFNVSLQDAAGNGTTSTRQVTLWPCERYDYDYWSPVIGAWVAAVVAIIAARFLFVRIFSRESL